ncbi:UNVERIFIED_ORG: hypothetical protein LHJ69_05450 [Shinella sp. XGS7]|nr:hypothetical protein [Shinella sp. XGS7]
MRKLSMVLDEGTRTTVSVGPRFTVRHTSRTTLAKEHSPNRMRYETKVMLGMYGLVMGMTSMFVGEASLWVAQQSFLLAWFTKLLVALAAGAVFFAIIRLGFPAVHERLKWAWDVDQKDAEDFHNKWLCMQCGGTKVVA